MTRTAAEQAPRESRKHAGRPPLQFTQAQIRKIDELAEAQCKDFMIAEVVGIDPDTFKRHFAERCQRKRALGKSRVLQAQFSGSLKSGKGAVTERIWFGKQHLEQSDQANVNIKAQITLNDAAVALRVAGAGDHAK